MSGADGVRPIRGRVLVQNASVDFIGKLVPGLIALVAIPVIVSGLGEEGYGLLAIVLTLLAYFQILDIGMSAATTKIAASYFGEGDTGNLTRLVATAVISILAVAVVSAVAMVWVGIPLLVDALNLSPNLVESARESLYLLVAGMPVFVATTAISAVLVAAQRLDVLNLIKVPAESSTYVIAAAGPLYGLGLVEIVGLIVAFRVAAGIIYGVACLKLFPSMRERPTFDWSMARRLAGYGKWMTVVSILAPVIFSFDRFFLGAWLSVQAVAFYVAPFQLISALRKVPHGMTNTLFPAFSTAEVSQGPERVGRLFSRGTKLLALFVAVPVVLFLGFSEEILHIWLGAEFAANSAIILRILALGVFIEAIAWVSHGLAMGLDRPDLRAKVYVAELPVYLLVLWGAVSWLGLAGAAVAWTIRAAVEAVAITGACMHTNLITREAFSGHGLSRAAILLAVGIPVMVLPAVLLDGFWVRALLVGGLLAVFTGAAWTFGLDADDRRVMIEAVPLLERSEHGQP